MKKKLLYYTPIIISIVFVLITILIVSFNFFNFPKTQKEIAGEVVVKSTLIDAIDVSELSTSQFTYNGIATVYKNNSSKIKCNIYYKSTVEAKIDINDIDFVIDNKNKTIMPILPDFQFSVHAIDNQPLSFIPSNAKIDLQEAYTICQKDALEEASKSEELKQSAEENLKSIIEALTSPILQPNNYTIIWK